MTRSPPLALTAAAVEAAEHEERQAGELRLTAAREVLAAGLRDAHEAAYQQIAAETGAGWPRSASGATTPRSWPRCSPRRAALPAATVGRVAWPTSR
jgi:hypothetical protein